MNNILKSWKTTLIGFIAIGGFIYNAYSSGVFNIENFLILVTGLGFLVSKDADRTHSITRKTGSNPDPSKEEK